MEVEMTSISAMCPVLSNITDKKFIPPSFFCGLWLKGFPRAIPYKKIARTRSEMVGAWGLTLRDARLIYPETENLLDYWKAQDQRHKDWDYFDLKADLWGPNFEFDLVLRKARNFAAVYRANLILPWTAPEVASYIGRLPEKYHSVSSTVSAG
ncbi:hypothetical protein [Thermosulfurimonas marina]|uniref:hypothetical protein n=1 Tax=Thermosulfurimonas marina TaxID=2047767 RepID=UPI001FEB0456|nr:hypothetical protein [Thermosulfurimonas marina]